ncbi:MAG: hypothetical protein RL104_291, partial [Bacteroidota bacterium]
QLTGMSNFHHAGQALGVDFVMQPELVRTPKYAAQTAGWFWQTHEFKWSRITGQKLKVVSRDAFKMLEYRFADAEGKKIG